MNPYLLVNLVLAVVFFTAAFAVAGWVLLRSGVPERFGVATAVALGAIGLGFALMTQYWVDDARMDEALDLAVRSLDPRRDGEEIDAVCRAAMTTVPALAREIADPPAAMLDQLSFEFDADAFAPPETPYDPRSGFVRASVSYLVPAPDATGGAPGQRIYFDLRPEPWRPVRAYRKEWRDGRVVEAPIWHADLAPSDSR